MTRKGVSAGLMTIICSVVMVLFAPGAAAVVTCAVGSTCAVQVAGPGTFVPGSTVDITITGPLAEDLGTPTAGPDPTHEVANESAGETRFAPLYDGVDEVAFAATELTAASDGSMTILIPISADAPIGECADVVATGTAPTTPPTTVTVSEQVCSKAAAGGTSGGGGTTGATSGGTPADEGTIAFTGGGATIPLAGVGAILFVVGAGIVTMVLLIRRRAHAG